MIHFEFGNLAATSPSGRTAGEFGLMIERASWRIERFGTLLASDAERSERVNGALRKLSGKRIVRASFKRALTRLLFEQGYKLSIRPATGLYGVSCLENWVLFERDRVALFLGRDNCRVV